MRLKRTLIPLLFAILLLNAPSRTCAQSGKNDEPRGFPVRIVSSSDNVPQRYGMWKSGNQHLSIGTHMERFLTDRYYQFSNAGLLENNVGFEASYAVSLFAPLEVEATCFFCKYDNPLYETMNGDIQHLGLELYLNAYVLPYIGKISDCLAPYLGIGYQSSSLTWDNNISANTSSAIVKLGLRLVFSRIYFQGEYRQTLPPGSYKLFRVINFGLGFNI